jgi:hypothetical protein
MVYNKGGMFVGPLNDLENIDDIIDQFGKKIVKSSNSNCIDYRYVSWIKEPRLNRYECGGFAINIKDRSGARSYNADLSCLPAERNCSKIEFDGVAFRIEVLDGELVSLKGFRVDGSTYVFESQ